jgi:hypothetical protein
LRIVASFAKIVATSICSHDFRQPEIDRPSYATRFTAKEEAIQLSNSGHSSKQT